MINQQRINGFAPFSNTLLDKLTAPAQARMVARELSRMLEEWASKVQALEATTIYEMPTIEWKESEDGLLTIAWIDSQVGVPDQEELMLRRIASKRLLPKTYFRHGPVLDVLEYEMQKAIQAWFIEANKQEPQDIVELPSIMFHPDKPPTTEEFVILYMEGLIEVPEES